MENCLSMELMYPVLIVDDEASVLSAIKRELRTLVPVFTCQSPKEARLLLKKHTFALIISDYKMPEENGVDFLSSITKQVSYEPIKVLMTAFSELDLAVEAINKAGIYYFLRKPWNHLELSTLVERALQSFQERNELGLCRQRLNSIEDIKKGISAILKHELNTPLTTLKGYVSLLDSKSQNPELNKIFCGLKNGVERLENFVAQVLELSNIELTELKEKELNISELIKESFNFIKVEEGLKIRTIPEIIKVVFKKIDAVSGYSELNNNYLLLVLDLKNNNISSIKNLAFMEPSEDVNKYSSSELELSYVALMLKKLGINHSIISTENSLRLELVFKLV